MAEWKTEVFENEYLAADATDVHAIVSVTCTGAGTAGQSGAAAEVIIVDTSGSMSSPHDQDRRRRGKRPRRRSTRSSTARGSRSSPATTGATLAFPDDASPTSRRRTRSEGGGAALRRLGWHRDRVVAQRRRRTLFATVEATQRHAILLTDGKNESETPSVLDRAVEAAQGVFQCDCRGVGADWDVNELRDIASALLGIGRHHRRARAAWPTTSGR